MTDERLVRVPGHVQHSQCGSLLQQPHEQCRSIAVRQRDIRHEKIDPARLPREQQENYRTIQSFLVKAREALSTRDVQRAFTLADKAYFLADEMSKTPR